VEGEERLGRALAHASKLVREHFDQTLRAVGSSFPTYLVLRHAELSPGVSQRELAERLRIEAPTLVRHVDRLVADGLVERVQNSRDRRVSHVQLTVKGRQHLRRLDTSVERLNAELAALFSESELATLYGLLHRISDRYSKEADVHRAG
jgi:MarR family transcriptional regulator for hemolysin